MRSTTTIMIGKAVRRLSRLRGGSGSALPGLIAERIDPGFMRRSLQQLPRGVVLISGTNGKTTTTKMVVELLESQGLRVFTNRTGSNFTRGVTAALLSTTDARGKLGADIAVLELDEAHAVHFVREVPPTYSLLLNVLRDQLDRFGEIDHTAQLLRKIAIATTSGIVINRDDPRLGSSEFVANLAARNIRSFGVSSDLLATFPSDEQLRGEIHPTTSQTKLSDDTELVKFDESHATISYGGATRDVEMKLRGVYNLQNATGAVALVRLIMGAHLDEPAMLSQLAEVTPAFGRGESIVVGGQSVDLILVKNPSGFRLSLSSFDPTSSATMIAVNDNYADGRDMSWLWDVDFDSLGTDGVQMVSGVRAYDMALRLQYDLVEVGLVEPDLSRALDTFLVDAADRPRRIYCTYTAMLAIRRRLSKIADEKVEAIS